MLELETLCGTCDQESERSSKVRKVASSSTMAFNKVVEKRFPFTNLMFVKKWRDPTIAIFFNVPKDKPWTTNWVTNLRPSPS